MPNLVDQIGKIAARVCAVSAFCSQSMCSELKICQIHSEPTKSHFLYTIHVFLFQSLVRRLSVLLISVRRLSVLLRLVEQRTASSVTLTH